MTQRAILLAGIAALLAAPAGASVSGFRLPPAPTPTPTSNSQGPVDEAAPVRPAPAPAPAPSPSRTTTAPTPSPTPRATAPASQGAKPTPAPLRTGPAAAPAPAPARSDSAPGPIPAATASGTAAAPPPAQPFPVATSVAATTLAEDEGGASWPWLAAILLSFGAVLGLFLWIRRRVGPLGPVIVPEIERPRVPPAPEPLPEPVFDPQPVVPPPGAVPAPTQDGAPQGPLPLHISIEPRKLSLTLMNATLAYRLALNNRDEAPLEDIAVNADLIGAHATLSREDQLAGPATELAERHRLAAIAPGETSEVAGELRLPLNMVRPIAQGDAVLFVPLARFRITGRGMEPRCFTLVVGQPSPRGGGIQPIRLDLGPRIYDGLAGRAF